MSCAGDFVLKGFSATGALVCADPLDYARTTLALCGSAGFDAANFVPAGSGLQVVHSCTPNDNMRAMLVTRSGYSSVNAAALQTDLDPGGIVVTEFMSSVPVYNRAFGTSYPMPVFGQQLAPGCQEHQPGAADPERCVLGREWFLCLRARALNRFGCGSIGAIARAFVLAVHQRAVDAPRQ